MYSRSGKLQLPYTELSEEVKAAKARVYTTFEESEDPCVRGANLKVDGGRKSDTPGSVEDAKSRLRMKEIVGIPNKDNEGRMRKRSEEEWNNDGENEKDK